MCYKSAAYFLMMCQGAATHDGKGRQAADMPKPGNIFQGFLKKVLGLENKKKEEQDWPDERNESTGFFPVCQITKNNTKSI